MYMYINVYVSKGASGGSMIEFMILHQNLGLSEKCTMEYFLVGLWCKFMLYILDTATTQTDFIIALMRL